MPSTPKVVAAAKCGHEVTNWLPRWQHDFWRERVGQRDCRQCVHDAENAQAALDARIAGLPPLTGKSERQRAYGETCRAFVLERMVEILEANGLISDGLGVAIMPLVEQGEATAFRGVLRYMQDQTDAAFWCDCKTIGDQSGLTGHRLAILDFVMERMGLGKRTVTTFQPVDGHMEKAAQYGR